jgi:hypothetical protein
MMLIQTWCIRRHQVLSFLDRAIEKIDNCVLEANSWTVLDSVSSTRRNGWKQVGDLGKTFALFPCEFDYWLKFHYIFASLMSLRFSYPTVSSITRHAVCQRLLVVKRIYVEVVNCWRNNVMASHILKTSRGQSTNIAWKASWTDWHFGYAELCIMYLKPHKPS